MRGHARTLLSLWCFGVAVTNVAAQTAPAAPAAGQQPTTAAPNEKLSQPRWSFPLTSGTDLTATSAYVWRGFIPANTFTVQPNVWVKLGNLTVSSWSNVAGRRVGGPLTEHDLTVDYSTSVGRYRVSAGWINSPSALGCTSSWRSCWRPPSSSASSVWWASPAPAVASRRSTTTG